MEDIDNFIVKELERENQQQLQNCVDQCFESLDVFRDLHTCKHWERSVDPLELFHVDLSDLPTKLSVERNPVTGQIEKFAEVNVTENERTKLSLTRKPVKPDTSIMGASLPFLPGGMEEDIDSFLKSLKVENPDVHSDESYLSVPPGFANGMNLQTADGAASVAALNQISDLATVDSTFSELSLDDLVQLLEKMPTTSSAVPSLSEAQLPKGVGSGDDKKPSNGDELDELLAEMPHKHVVSNVSRKQGKLQWAEMLDVLNPVLNFNEQVPQMAHKYPFELDIFQKQAILHLEKGDSVFVAAHTSAGKTVIAEYAIALCKQHGTRAAYTSPIKALSNQKFGDFLKTFVDVGLITGDIQLRPDAFCLIMTTEILRLMLYHGSELIRDLEWVIFDEVHYINDLERGVVWEEVLIMLPLHVKIIMLSATVPNTLEFADWVGRIKKRKIYVISTSKRPVPLEHFLYMGVDSKTKDDRFLLVDKDGHFLNSGYSKALETKKLREKPAAPKTAAAASKNPKGAPVNKSQITTSKPSGIYKSDKGLYLSLIDHLKSRDQLPVIIFTFSRQKCDDNAQLLSSVDLTTTKEKSDVLHFFRRCMKLLKGTDTKLRQLLAMKDYCTRGFAVHHAGILPVLKETVEILFQRGLVKTFAMGVNMPARTVVFDSTSKHDGRSRRDLLAGEYCQMAGRAGRRGLDATGNCLILCKIDIPELADLHKMIMGKPTKLESRFRVTYSMVLNLLRVELIRPQDMLQRCFAENPAMTAALKRREELKIIETELNYFTADKQLCNICDEECLSGFYSVCKEYSDLRKKAMQHVITLFSKSIAGRVVIFSQDGYINCPAICLNISGKLDSGQLQLQVLVSCRPVNEASNIGSAEMQFPLDLALDAKITYLPNESSNSPHSSAVITVRTTDSILFVTPKTIKVTPSVVLEDWNTRQQPKHRFDQPCGAVLVILEQLRKICEDWKSLADIPSLDQCSPKELALLDLDARDFLRRLQVMKEQIRSHKCLKCSDLVSHFVVFIRHVNTKKRYEELKSLLSEANLLLLPEYQAKIQVLKELGYIDTEDMVTLKGKVACEIHHQELFVTELLFENFFAELTPEQIAATLSCATCQEKHGSQTITNENLKQIKDKVLHIIERIAVVQRKYQIPDYDIENELRFDLMEVVYEWARGMPFYQITMSTNSQEGIIVRCVQRLDELCKDVRNASKIIGEPMLQKKMEQTSVQIKRDIVFTESLYTQAIVLK